jgi:cell division transport system permease protein
MKQIRIAKRIIIETLIGFKQSGWSNWLVISILAIALTTFGGILQLTMTLKNVVGAWGSQLEISAYLKDDYPPSKIAQEISALPEVSSVEIVPKDKAWSDMQSTFKVALLNNPLPNTIHIKLKLADQVEQVAPRIRLLAGIENIRYPMKVARRINEFRHFLEVTGIVLTAALTAATLTVMGNTIHLVIQSRQREIEILSLMGISPSYIKSPLILQGAAYGAVSAVLAVTVLWGIHFYLDPMISEQLFSIAPLIANSMQYSLTKTFLALLVFGVFVGAIGGFWTSGRYIKI